MVAKVLIDNAVHKLNKVYDYMIKKEDELLACVGQRVRINFGNGKGSFREGIIVKLIDDSECDKLDKLKYIDEILDTESFIDENRLKLAKWMSKMYFCNVYSALKLMLPATPNKKLKQKELVGKQIAVVVLKESKQKIEQDIESKIITSAKHIKLLRELEENNEIPVDDIVGSLGISKAVIKTVVEKGYIELLKKDNIIDEPEPERPVVVTKTATVTVNDLRVVTLDGNSVIYITGDDGNLYKNSIASDETLMLIKNGDKITVTYIDTANAKIKQMTKWVVAN